MKLQTFPVDEPLLILVVRLMLDHKVKKVIRFHDFRQNHPDLTQIASQGFLWLDIHPRDGFLERNELTDIFTDQDKDGYLF